MLSFWQTRGRVNRGGVKQRATGRTYSGGQTGFGRNERMEGSKECRRIYKKLKHS